MNMVVAFILIWIVGASQGEAVTTTVIESVQAGTPAVAADVGGRPHCRYWRRTRHLGGDAHQDRRDPARP